MFEKLWAKGHLNRQSYYDDFTLKSTKVVKEVNQKFKC